MFAQRLINMNDGQNTKRKRQLTTSQNKLRPATPKRDLLDERECVLGLRKQQRAMSRRRRDREQRIDVVAVGVVVVVRAGRRRLIGETDDAAADAQLFSQTHSLPAID